MGEFERRYSIPKLHRMKRNKLTIAIRMVLIAMRGGK